MLLEVIHLSLYGGGYVQGVGYIIEAFLQLIQSAPVVINIPFYLHEWDDKDTVKKTKMTIIIDN